MKKKNKEFEEYKTYNSQLLEKIINMNQKSIDLLKNDINQNKPQISTEDLLKNQEELEKQNKKLKILLEEKNRLIFDYKKLKFEHINKFDLLCYGLVNSSQKAVEAYHDNLIKYMGKSIDCFHEVVNKVIIPLCRVANHPLGVGALDEFLSAFSTAAERDVWWSIPILSTS